MPFDIDPLSPPTPQKFLSSLDLWMGVLLAAALVAATVRLRRDRAPL